MEIRLKKRWTPRSECWPVGDLPELFYGRCRRQRLHHQEESYAAAPGTIEQEEDNLPTLSSAGGFGAPRLVAIALIAVGLLSLS
jgi:hypothetical protein